jgi:hypothetical protein
VTTWYPIKKDITDPFGKHFHSIDLIKRKVKVTKEMDSGVEVWVRQDGKEAEELWIQGNITKKVSNDCIRHRVNFFLIFPVFSPLLQQVPEGTKLRIFVQDANNKEHSFL